ncbi:MAG TPA: hypothetical protein VFB62_01715 [Polyangiaceae bacterium]|nr:hypothetical protein [Polyangiaceae bacterium]
MTSAELFTKHVAISADTLLEVRNLVESVDEQIMAAVRSLVEPLGWVHEPKDREALEDVASRLLRAIFTLTAITAALPLKEAGVATDPPESTEVQS